MQIAVFLLYPGPKYGRLILKESAAVLRAKGTFMLKVYGSPLCPDCRECRANLDAHGVAYDYVDITASMLALREFLAQRDTRGEFAPAKAQGAIGIPAIFSEDGAVTLDWEGYLASLGLPVVYKKSGPCCSIDGKNC